MSDHGYAILAALNDFRRARKRAATRSLIARLTGRSDALLSFEEVRQKLKATVGAGRQLRDIPLDAIVGSVGRTSDFTRDFLPRSDNNQQRWARVKAAMDAPAGVPPIEVYQVGGVYFVLDGNHRVSAARAGGATHIQAYVADVQSRVPLTPNTSPDDLIVKVEYADFLEHTGLDRSRPDADLTTSVPGQYAALERQIEAQQAVLAADRGQPVAFEQAAAAWYDTTYLPIARIIREHGILHEFPGRTETDLYVWISEHRDEIEQAIGWQVTPDDAAADLALRRSQRPARVVARLGERLREAVMPETLETGPPPGTWRQTRHATPHDTRLAADVLVAISGEPAGWHALDYALYVARQEDARLAGLHMVTSADQRGSAAVTTIKAEFDRRCAAAGVSGRLAVEVGGAAHWICARARWTDLVVASLSHPPGAEPITRLRSGFRAMVQRSPRPILAVPDGVAVAPRRALLPYDGSPKAEEALFIAAYLVLRWKLSLTVLSVVPEPQSSSAALERARGYLDAHAAPAIYLLKHGAVAETILATAEAQESDVILIGGYGYNPLLEIVLGSTVDQVLCQSRRPVLICQ